MQTQPRRWNPLDSDVTRDLPGCEAANALGVRTFVGIPIHNSDGTDFGTLCAASTQTRTLDHTSITEIEALAALIADHTTRHESPDVIS